MLFLIVGGMGLVGCTTQITVPSPVLKADGFPEPPMQHAAWTPPKTDLPADLITATTRLFQQGLADPRGCEYRSIRVRVGDKGRGDAGLLECHGWVLPQEGKDPRRFAVCWNGLVYPTDWVGDKASIAKDIDISIHRDVELEETFCQESFDGVGGSPGTRSFNCMASEHATISQLHMLPIRVCLLLRLGEVRLAERFWAAWEAKDSDKCDRYKLIAIALEWSMYDCAMNARQRGDDKLSITYLRKAHQLEKLVKDDAAASNVDFDFGLEFQRCLDAVPSLIADEQRRISQGYHGLALAKGRAAFATKGKWIEALVGDMDRISVMDERGLGDVSQDPVARALIDAGDDAVEPLLDCYEYDARPTSAGRPPMPVREAAYSVLKQILHVERFGPDLQFDRTITVEQRHDREVQLARNFWAKAKYASDEQRDLLILADDQLSSSDWYNSVDKLIAAINRRRADPIADKAETTKLVSDFINTVDHLVKSLNKRREDSESWVLLYSISDWDQTADLPLLRKQVEYLKSTEFMNYEELAWMAAAMAHAGDRSGLEVYCDWLRKLPMDPMDRCSEDLLKPLYLFQDDPAISATATAIFDGLHDPVNFISTNDELIGTPLLGIKSFRQQVLRALDDKRLFGTVTVRANHKFDFVDSNGTLDTNPGVGQIPRAETRLGRLDVPMTIRKCDRYAMLIADAGGPEMQYYWPESDRDTVVADCKAFLVRYGPRLRYTPGYGGDIIGGYLYQVTFPVLDHVASKQEADSLQAVFSLEGEGERRLVKIPRPILANWITLKKHPAVWTEYVSDFSGTKSTDYFANGCWVWQAEEVKVNGVWKRYYGVSGSHEIAKVAAEEIEFGPPWLGDPSGASLTGGTDILLVPPGSWSENDHHFVAEFSDPLIARIRIHNRRGVPLELPSQILLTLAKNRIAIRPGITMTLYRIGESGSTQGDPKQDTPVSARKMQPLSADQLNRHQIVESNAVLEDKDFDLRDCFDINIPGVYRLQMTLAKESGIGEGTTPEVIFELK